MGQETKQKEWERRGMGVRPPSGQLRVRQQKAISLRCGKGGCLIKLGSKLILPLTVSNWPSPHPGRVRVTRIHAYTLNKSGLYV